MYCPHCGNKLAGCIGRTCGSCGGDIQLLAPALVDGAEQLSDEMREAALFHGLLSEGQTFEGAEELEPGDLIEIFRGIYQHWAVYIGDGDVVHLVALGIGSSGAPSSGSGDSVSGQVRKDKLKHVINKDKWKKNNIKHTSCDNKLKPKPEKEIVKKAVSMVGKAVEYSVTSCNCEHFATECRYGKALSLQVKELEEAAVGAGTSLLGSIVLGGMITSSVYR